MAFKTIKYKFIICIQGPNLAPRWYYISIQILDKMKHFNRLFSLESRHIEINLQVFEINFAHRFQ